MDFNSSRKMAATITTPKRPERKSQVNVTKNGNTTSQKCTRHPKLPLLTMMSSRTPLQSPNTSFVSQNNSRREEKLPVKRCFSKEVLELSHQIIVTQHSKVDISLCPPKRIRLDHFTYSSSQSQHHAPARTSSSSNNKRKEMLRLKPPSPAKLSLPPPDKATVMKSHPHHKQDGVRFHPAKSTAIVLRKKTNSTTSRYSHFLVSVKNFPREEWRENNYNAEMLREIIFLSDADAIPVDLVKKDDQLIVKFLNVTKANDFTRKNSPCDQKGILLHDIIISSLSLPFKVISGVIRWIIGM